MDRGCDAGPSNRPLVFVHQLKLRPPQLLPTWLERPEIARRFAAHPGVVSIVAGPGYGKTVLAAQYFAAHNGTKLWYSLDTGDADLAVFAAHFDALLHSNDCAPRLQGEAWRLGSIREIASIFAAALGDLPAAPLLIFDDVHVLENSRSLDVLEELVRRLISTGATVVICGRSMPLPLHAFAVKGQLIRTSAVDLAFSDAESRQYLQRTASAAQSEDGLARLVRRAEGWPAGLTLIGSTGSRLREPSATVPADSEEARQLLFDYLAAEVLGALTERERRFLVETSVLEELEEALCAELTGFPEAGRLLRSFAMRGLFINRKTDDAYSAHRLFREFLQQELEASYEAGDVLELHRRVAHAYLRRGDSVRAIEHLLQAGNVTEAISELEGTIFALLATGLVSRVRTFLRQVGTERVARSPALLAAQGRLAQLRGDWDDALVTLERALQLASEAREYAIVAEAVRAISPILAARGEFGRLENLLARAVSFPLPEAGRTALLLTQSAVYVETERYDDALALFEQIMPSVVARGDLAIQGMVLHNTGAAHVRRGEPHAGIAFYERALRVKRSAGQRVSALVTLANQIYVLLLIGDTGEAEALVAQLLEDAADLANATVLAHGYESLGAIRLLRGDAAGAVDACRKAREACDPGDVLVLPYVLHGYGRALLAQNEPERADELCAKAVASMRTLGREQPLAPVVLTRARCAFARAQHERGVEHVEEALVLAATGEDAVVRASVNVEAAAILVGAGAVCESEAERARVADIARAAALAALALIEQRDYRFLLRTKAAEFAALSDSLQKWKSAGSPAGSSALPVAFQVELFGGLRVFVRGEAVPAKAWTRRKARELFAHLVLLRGRLVPRARLIDQHWPDTEADTAHDLLRVTISSVRKAIGDVIRYEDGGYRFVAPAGTVIDIDAFERSLEAGRAADARGDSRAALRAYSDAATLYSGDFLEGTDDGSWFVRERERLRSAYLEALRWLVRREPNEPAQHSAFVDRLLEEVPWDVEAVKMRLASMTKQLRTREAALEYERWKAAYRVSTGADAPHIWAPVASENVPA